LKFLIKKTYFIRDFAKGTGLFAKIDKKFELIGEQIISFCNTHIFVNKIDKVDNVLKIKFLQGQFKDQSFAYNPLNQSAVKIGRSKDLDIVYKDDSISRFQCSFLFDNNTWYVQDGVDDKKSTNGIWLLASKGIEIQNDMIIKTGNSTFKTSIE